LVVCVVHPLINVRLSDVYIGCQIGICPAIRTLELRIDAVFPFQERSNALVVPHMSARSDK
jgi:hypothetical protein